MKPIKAYSYIRWSSKGQGDGDSLRRQTAGAENWAAANGYELAQDRFVDAGISGFKDTTQAGLDEFHGAIQAGRVSKGSVLIIDAIDRIGRRGMLVTQNALERILSSGVDVVALNEGITLTGDSLHNDITAVLRVCLAADLAASESRKKSARVLAAKKAGREKPGRFTRQFLQCRQR